MKRILLTALLIVTANTASALQLSIQHNKDLPTPWELMSKGKIIDKRQLEKGYNIYYIAWDKTDDIYWCVLKGYLYSDTNTTVTCRLATQETQSTVK